MVMKLFKKIWLLILGIVIFWTLNFSFALRNPFVKPLPQYKYTVTASGDQVVADGSRTLAQKIVGIISTPEPITDHETALNRTIHLIQITINRLLWILATVALIYMLYSGFQIFTSGDSDSGAKKWRQGLKNSAVALAGIGLSWLIVSAILRFINNVASNT